MEAGSLPGARFSSDVTGAAVCLFLKSPQFLRHLTLKYLGFPPDTFPDIQVINMHDRDILSESI